MTVKLYRAKPVTIEAIEWTGDNWEEIKAWTNGLSHMTNNKLYIETIEGTSPATVGDFIARGTQGEFYPIKPRVMTDKYDRVDEDA